MAQAEKPDLLITDYHMPHLSGLELCQKLRKIPRSPTFPRSLLSARGYNLEEVDTEKSGIVRMISKPFSPRQLLTAVDEVLAAVA